MTIFNVLTLIGGLSLFLFGMNLMGQGLERSAGSGLEKKLSRLTSNRITGFLTGLGVTAVIQSSSATTVMVVGFVNSGLMTLRQAINVIMGANVGTTVTAWILSLTGIDSSNVFVSLLKPSSFTPVLAFIGIIFFMMSKNSKRKDTGLILLSFATLMFGMETMSSAVSGLKNVPEFQQLFVTFSNPILGVLAGAVLTAVIQSSSASVGILQALATTGAVSYGAAIPIIMGQNIGTCITAILSSIGTNKNAKRAALVHLAFNIIGAAVWLTVFCIIRAIFAPAILSQPASLMGIAVFHSVFNILCTILVFPFSGTLEKIVCKLIPDSKIPEKPIELDERLLASPPLATSQCRQKAKGMARISKTAMQDAVGIMFEYDQKTADKVEEAEQKLDTMEDKLSTYLLKLSQKELTEKDSSTITELLHTIGDFERIGDHAINMVKISRQMNESGLQFSEEAKADFVTLFQALTEISELAVNAYTKNDVSLANKVEPLEEVIDKLTAKIKHKHIERMKNGLCSPELGVYISDLLVFIERISDHYSNVAVIIIQTAQANVDKHDYLNELRAERNPQFVENYEKYKQKYRLAEQK